MGWTFNSPPGWPQQPPGWSPPPGWTPDPSWPPPPAGWQFWVETPPGAAAAPYPPPHPAGRPPKAWFARWWGILGLAGALLVGGLVGFGGTNVALSGDEETPLANDSPQPSPSAAAPPSEPPQPSPEPVDPPTAGPDELCGEVAVIMIQMFGENLEAVEADDPQAELVASRRSAAEKLRDVDAADTADREALDTFADELDGAADDLADGPLTEEGYDAFVDRGQLAWDEFNATVGC